MKTQIITQFLQLLTGELTLELFIETFQGAINKEPRLICEPDITKIYVLLRSRATGETHSGKIMNILDIRAAILQDEASRDSSFKDSLPELKEGGLII
jgi:hypothetical protein